MPQDVLVPSPGESVSEGFLAVWYKRSGDYVQENEPLFKLESDKAAQDVTAKVAGVLKITVPEGTQVAVGAAVATIDDKAAKPQGSAKTPTPTPATPASPPAPAKTTTPPAAEVLLSPAARNLAANKDINPADLVGTGRGGRVIKEDVLAHASASRVGSLPPGGPDKGNGSPSAPPSIPLANPVTSPAGRETRQRMSTIRQRIAERLLQAQQTAAILTTFNEADMSAIMALRTRYKDAFQKKYGIGLGFMSFFVKACVEALRAFPAVNSRVDGTDIVYHNFHSIGVAVSTEKGLMVPVLRDCQSLTFAGIEKGIGDLAKKAREDKITIADLQGGTFTITNGGVFGSLLSTPILNPPQSAILGMHTIQKRPVVVDDQIVIRPMMYLALSYDHRIVDGREAVGFLVRVKECVENPDRLLLEI